MLLKYITFFLLTAVFFYDVIEYRLLYRTQPLNLILLNSSWYEKGFLLQVLLNEKYKSYLWQTFIVNSWTQISVAKNSVKNCSQMRLTGLLISETGKIGSKGHWHDCSKQVTLAQLFQGELAWLFSNDTGTIIPKWNWRDYSQVKAARLLPSETDTVVPQWVWHDYSKLRLARLFLNETFVPKWR